MRAPHPSPKNLNSRPHYRAKIVAALAEARVLAGLPPRAGVPAPPAPEPQRAATRRRVAEAPRRAQAGQLDRREISELLKQGLTPERVNNRLGPRREIWIAAIEEEARRAGELDALAATPAEVTRLRHDRSLRWEAIAARVYGDARKTTAVKRLYEEANGASSARHSWTGRGRRFAEME